MGGVAQRQLLECDNVPKEKSKGGTALSWLLECDSIAKERVPFEEVVIPPMPFDLANPHMGGC
jgi:hypothetical protein